MYGVKDYNSVCEGNIVDSRYRTPTVQQFRIEDKKSYMTRSQDQKKFEELRTQIPEEKFIHYHGPNRITLGSNKSSLWSSQTSR